MNSSTNPEPPSKELRDLVDGLLADTLTRSEFARLEERLESDPAARNYYLEVAGNEALMSLALEEAGGRAQVLPQRRASRLWPLAMAAAVVVGAGSVVLIALQPWSGDERSAQSDTKETRGTEGLGGPTIEIEDSPVSLTGELGAIWADGGRKVAAGKRLVGNQVEIEAGVVEIAYRNGVNLLIEGPAHYEITGPNTGRLNYGNLVADVPPKAEGFAVDFGEDRLIDRGAKFGLRFPRGSAAEMVVFRGETEISYSGGQASAKLQRGQAARRAPTVEGGLISIPFDRSLYVSELPSYELPWAMPPSENLLEPVPMEFDVTSLIRSPGEYHLLFKYLRGAYAVYCWDVELRLDGEPIAKDDHMGRAGAITHTYENMFALDIDASRYREGRWTVHLMTSNWVLETHEDPSDSEGVIIFDKVPDASVPWRDFIGSWEFWRDGTHYLREIRPDGTGVSKSNGKEFLRFVWEVQDGILKNHFPSVGLTETHILRGRDTLIFCNRPFPNARRVWGE